MNDYAQRLAELGIDRGQLERGFEPDLDHSQQHFQRPGRKWSRKGGAIDGKPRLIEGALAHLNPPDYRAHQRGGAAGGRARRRQ